MRYASPGSYRLGTPEVTLGILPGNGGTQRLPRLIGVAPALELLLTGTHVLARGRRAWGLVRGLYDPRTAYDRVRAYALRFATGPPLALGGDQARRLRGDRACRSTTGWRWSAS